MSFLEVKFEYAVECEAISDVEAKTPKDALAYATERWQEMCDEGDYEHGEGDVTLYCVCAETGEILMADEYKVFSEKIIPEEPPYLQSEFI